MILTLTMNPAVDIGYTMDAFHLDTTNRTSQISKTAGGKGLNVTRVLQELGSDVLATGFLGGNIGSFIKDHLDATHTPNSFYPINEESRNCIAILHDGQQTEILEAGPTITKTEQAGFLRHFKMLLPQTSLVTISGSLPNGIEPSYYTHLIAEAAGHNIPILVDTSGKTLETVLKSPVKPTLIKPNQEELAALLGVPVATNIAELHQQLQHHLFKGVEWIVVSLGAKGAYAKHHDRYYTVTIPKVNAVNPVGSGDATIAGLAHAIARGEADEEILATGVTCGTLNAMEKQTGHINMKNFDNIYAQVDVQV